MGPFETLGYAEAGRVATVTLKRPLTNMRLVRELTTVCDHLEDESPCEVVVLRGEGGVFHRGIDLTDFRPDQEVDIHGFNKWEKLCARIERLPKATVAAVDGAAMGGGVQLALVCDVRICTRGSTFQVDEVHRGFLPGMATWRLARFVGLGRARRMLAQARVVGAEEAHQIGLVDEVVDGLDAGIAAAVAAFGPVNTVALQLGRRLLDESSATAFEDAIGNFLAAQHRACTQPPFQATLAGAHRGSKG